MIPEVLRHLLSNDHGEWSAIAAVLGGLPLLRYLRLPAWKSTSPNVKEDRPEDSDER